MVKVMSLMLISVTVEWGYEICIKERLDSLAIIGSVFVCML